jgi:protein-disulfide isomerase
MAVAVIAVAIAISSGASGTTEVKPESKQAKTAVAHIDTLLAGIPESGSTLGRPGAPITVTEYGDLECSVCDVLATPPSVTNAEGESGTGWEDDLINQYVRTGRAKLVYRSLETASSGNPNPNAFELQQAAAGAAGLQDKAWYYIELFYNEQGAEDSGYVTESYLEGLARQIRGLNLSKWMADRNLAKIKNQVSSDNAAGISVDGGNAGTPTLVIEGQDGTTVLPPGLPSSYGELEATIKSVD